jgi:peptidyl-prolyl cis-trans isomerase SurA
MSINLHTSVICIGVALFLSSAAAGAEGQRIIATVNDRPVTTLDIDQQLRLQELLGSQRGAGGQRKAALNAVINEIVKIEEAKRFKMNASDRDIDNRVAEIAKGLKTDGPGLEVKLRKQGIGMRAMRQYVAAQIAFARLLRFKYKDDVKVNPADVDRKFAQVKADIDGRLQKVMADPRMKSITAYSLLEIGFPIDDPNDPAVSALLQSRAAEANQFAARFKGCKTARAAAAGIFNVKIGRTVEADASKLPKPLRSLMDSKGPGRAYGPMRAPGGIQLVAFCSKRTVSPQKPKVQYPTRAQIENVALDDKYQAVEKKYVVQMRKTAIIEYKDQAFAQ